MRNDFPVQSARVDWVDVAKAICIIMVVTMHSTLGVEAALGVEGWMHAVVDFTSPFRMPDFFLVSGLFMSRAIERDWRTFIDRRVVHFAYFYFLWLTIQFALKAPAFAEELGAAGVLPLYLMSFVDPFGLLWFIYLLAIFSVVTRLLRSVSPIIVFAFAAMLEIAPVHTGWVVVDEFCARFVYFFAGYWLAPRIFNFAREVTRWPFATTAALLVWAIFNGMAVVHGWAAAPGVSLLLGFAGAIAVVALATLVLDTRAVDALRYIGERSIAIYLAFFVPMAATRTILIKTGIVIDPGWMALIVIIAGVTGPLLIAWLVFGTRLGFLFERPVAIRLRDRPALQAAE